MICQAAVPVREKQQAQSLQDTARECVITGTKRQVSQNSEKTIFVKAKGEIFTRETDISCTLLARDYKGWSNLSESVAVVVEKIET